MAGWVLAWPGCPVEILAGLHEDVPAPQLIGVFDDGDWVALVTSDPNDLGHLLQTLGASVRLVTV